MVKTTLSRTDKRIAAIERREQAIKNEIDEAAENARKKTAELKALRLLRDAENLEASLKT